MATLRFVLCHCHGHSFFYHWILIFLSIFNCCVCFKNQYRWLSLKTSASTSSKSTFEEKFLSQRSQTSGLLLFAISFYNVWFMMLPWPMRLGILSYVAQFFICNLQVVVVCLLVASLKLGGSDLGSLINQMISGLILSFNCPVVIVS